MNISEIITINVDGKSTHYPVKKTQYFQEKFQ